MSKIHGFKITAPDTRQVDIPLEAIRKIVPSTDHEKSFIILKSPLSNTDSDRPTDEFNTVSDSSKNAVEVRFGFPKLKDMYERLMDDSVRSFDITSDTGPLSKYQLYTMRQGNNANSAAGGKGTGKI